MTPEELEATRCPICAVRLGHDVHCPDYPYSTRVRKWQTRPSGASTGARATLPPSGLPSNDNTQDERLVRP